MPEAAECKLEAEFLNSKLEGCIVVDWIFISGQYVNNTPPGFENFEKHLPYMVEQVSCKGKLIYFVMFNEYHTFYIMHSMRLTGSWSEERTETTRWYIELDTKERLWFDNPRCLATLDFTDNVAVFQLMLDKLGPSILSDEFTLKVWKQLTEAYRNKNITSFLMDQQIISGCGNYIKAEVLYYSRISPLRKVKDLTKEEKLKLFEALRIIPRQAYASMSYSYNPDQSDPDQSDPDQSDPDQSDPDQSDNERYIFKRKIYGHASAKQTRTVDGRITYWDPERQK